MRLLPLLLLTAVGATACDDSSQSEKWALTTRLVDSDMSRAAGASTAPSARSALAARSSLVHGLRMGELEVVAYDYRPGQAVQLNANFGYGTNGMGSTEWSYMSPLLSGHDSARDILLQNNGVVDLSVLANDAILGPPRPGDPFLTQVGAFDIDFLEVHFYRTGMLYDLGGLGNVADFHYFGMDADNNGLNKHPLHRYPPFASVGDSYAEPVFPDWKAKSVAPTGRVQAMSVLFSRRDWFPEARVVELEPSGMGGTNPFIGIAYDSLAASRPLSTTQKNYLLSLANEGTQRRGYDRFVIVPMDGPVRIEFDKNAAASAPLDPRVAPKNFDAANISIDLGFNVDGLIDERWTNPVPHEFNAPGGVEASVGLEVVTVASPGTYTLSYEGTDYSFDVPAGLSTPYEVMRSLHDQARAALPAARISETGGATFGASGFYPPPLGTSDAKLRRTETLPTPFVVWNGDANHVPFGLSVAFSTSHPLCAVNVPFNPSTSCHSVSPGSPLPSGCCVCPNNTTYSPAPGATGQYLCK
ncbi:hypothetical protein BO221_24605 [Archangium sp. Cb G35]|uniref:hypothetical protein n=1 Tax=Archangium sp. Cb G35 TaxID=1920190 RepID=UPI0009358904|nr:hypothetical protein [Archangium sp. Cb G35]OJT21936.1 hypothetical protein BO221_24605 [Archangium sp. Cb G35]